MKRVYDFLEKSQTYYLSTIYVDKPKTRPFGTINLFEEKLYFLTGADKDVSKQMHKNQNIEICAVHGDSWMRVSAKAILDKRKEPISSMLKKYSFLKANYSADDDNTEVWYLKDATAVIYHFNEIKEVILF